MNGRIFYEKVNKICADKGIKITQFITSLGFGNSVATNWKKGKIPSAATVKVISDALNVSADFLLSDDENVKFKPLSEVEIILLNLFSQLDEREKFRYIGRLEAYLETKAEFPGADG